MMDQMILRQTHWIFNDANLSKETFELGYQDYEKYDSNISFQMSFFSFNLSKFAKTIDTILDRRATYTTTKKSKDSTPLCLKIIKNCLIIYEVIFSAQN